MMPIWKAAIQIGELPNAAANTNPLKHWNGCQFQLGVNRVDLEVSAVCPVNGPSRASRYVLEGAGPDVIQVPKLEPRIMGYEHSDHEWAVIKPRLPNKPRGVPRVNDRRVLNGIFWVLRSGTPWRGLPEGYGPPTTCYNRFVRWRRAGVWDRIMEALAAAHNAAVYGPLARRTDQQGARRSGRKWSAGAPWSVARRGSWQQALLRTSDQIASKDDGAWRPWL